MLQLKGQDRARKSKKNSEQQMINFNRSIAPRAPLANRGFSSMSLIANRERKYFDTPGQNWNVNNAGTFILAFVPQTGTDFNNRVGRKTIAKSIYIRGSIRLNAAHNIEGNPLVEVISAPQTARMIIFIDSQPNGAAPILTDLLTEAAPDGQLNPNNRDRFRILKDKLFAFDSVAFHPLVTVPGANFTSTSYAAWNRTMYNIKVYKKLNMETIFNQLHNGDIGDISTNAMYVFFIGSHAASATLAATARITIRVRFDDA